MNHQTASTKAEHIGSAQYKSKSIFREGIKDGLPIGLGYFAVAFSLGIAAKSAGLTPSQGFLASILTNASAGEYAGFTIIAEKAAYLEMVLFTFIANARYMLMSCALSQRMAPDLPFWHRFLIGFSVTDELFAISVARPGFLNPFYTYGAMLIAMPLWAIGTSMGIIAGNLLPAQATSALSVALYGMFLAVIIPPARKSKTIGALILICFIASYCAAVLPGFRSLSGGTRTIILTVAISTGAALLFPVKHGEKI
ncbi:MAG: AzlC family ABC transporter permease [Clostridiaceae bacterium]|nr:AzlC family ABC transporter permease [Clostridiaceae bacterium]